MLAQARKICDITVTRMSKCISVYEKAVIDSPTFISKYAYKYRLHIQPSGLNIAYRRP